MRVIILRLLLSTVIVAWPPVATAEWSDWWQTPEQKAADALRRGDLEALQKAAPEGDWRAVGEYEAKDYGAAAQSFGNAANVHRDKGDTSAENDAIYNQGVSQVRNGQYQEAVDSFNTILDRDPSYVDAEHNRQIAEKLMQLQQQEQQSEQQSGDGGEDNQEQGQQEQQSGDGGEENQEQGQQEQQSDNGEQQESSDEQDAQSQNDQSSDPSDQQSGDAPQQQDSETSPLSDEEQEQRDAEQALAAEAADDEQTSEQGEQNIEAQPLDVPMSEADQAAEQLLRRIPDDPAGLLQRKLEQNHRSEYPEVGNARQPW